jgi:dihydroneopterin aldolase
MMFYSYHGASRAERETGRRYEVDVELHADLTGAARTDNLTDTINYTRVYDTVAEIIQGKKYNLLETIAAMITNAIKDNYQADRVVVRVRKKIPPIPGNLDHIEVEFDSGTDVT